MSKTVSKESSKRRLARAVRDTTESIVIALILAFVFRAFAVQAYRIPTGSMAPTLYGAHRTRICRDCGKEYAYEIRRNELPNGRTQLLVPGRTVCPNCRWTQRPLPLYQAGRAVIDSGDRILVLKVGYDLANRFPSLAQRLGPKRWDTVVFKNPADPGIDFIKRLIGLPGEKIEIIHGDIFVNDKIQRNSPAAQRALWFTVYDADYLPNRQSARPSWKPIDWPGPGPWDTSGRVMVFSGQGQGDQFRTIGFAGKLVDSYAYDDPDTQRPGQAVVSDLRVSMLLVPRSAGTDGTVRLLLSKRSDLFVAEIDLSGRARLLKGTRTPAGQDQMELLSQQNFAPIIEPTLISFANVDCRLSLTLGREEILSSNDQQYPSVADVVRQLPPAQDVPIVRISARGADLQLWHLRLERDVYYRAVRILDHLMPANHPLYNQPGHGVAGNAIQLGPEEYYVLGDNSPESKDSRLWWHVGKHLQNRFEAGEYKLGTVPADQLVGRAFFVYWPSWLRLFGSGPALIPNVGRMRFIR